MNGYKVAGREQSDAVSMLLARADETLAYIDDDAVIHVNEKKVIDFLADRDVEIADMREIGLVEAKTCEIKIDLTFTPTLDKCPSCSAEQEFGGGITECRNCGRRAGAALSDAWIDFVQAIPPAPRGWERNIHASSGDGFYVLLQIPERLSVEEIAALRQWVSQIGGKISESTFANIVFRGIDDPPVTFASEEAFLEFANGCDYHCDLRGTIENLEIEWSEEDGEWVAAYDEEGGHQLECVCADCADATLSTDND